MKATQLIEKNYKLDPFIKPNVNEAFEFFRLYNETKGEQIQGAFWYDGRNKVYSNVKIDEGRTTVKVNRRQFRGQDEFFADLRLTKQFDHIAVSNCWDYIGNMGNYTGERPSIEIITALDCLIKVISFILQVIFLFFLSSTIPRFTRLELAQTSFQMPPIHMILAMGNVLSLAFL